MPHDTPIDTHTPTDGASAERARPVADRSEEPGSETLVTVVGQTRRAFTSADLDALDHVTRDCTVECSSGDRTSGAWRGVPVEAVLGRAGAPADTTHVVVAGRDGYTVAVEIRHVLDGLLALERDGVPLTDGGRGTPRFVAPDVAGARAVTDVVSLETVSLAPDEDPDALEVLWPEDSDAAGELP